MGVKGRREGYEEGGSWMDGADTCEWWGWE